MPYTPEFFSANSERTYSLEQLRFDNRSFDPESFPAIPPPEVRITPLHTITGEPIADVPTREKYARKFIREALEKRHGKKVISLHQYENLRGLHPQAEFGGRNALEVYNAVQSGDIIVL